MHLHARRLIIDHPDGDLIDEIAELPEHFAASMAQLGFDQEDGAELPPAPPKPTRDSRAAPRAFGNTHGPSRPLSNAGLAPLRCRRSHPAAVLGAHVMPRSVATEIREGNFSCP